MDTEHLIQAIDIESKRMIDSDNNCYCILTRYWNDRGGHVANSMPRYIIQALMPYNYQELLSS